MQRFIIITLIVDSMPNGEQMAAHGLGRVMHSRVINWFNTRANGTKQALFLPALVAGDDPVYGGSTHTLLAGRTT